MHQSQDNGNNTFRLQDALPICKRKCMNEHDQRNIDKGKK